MQQPLQINFQGIDASDAIEAAIRRRARELEQYCGDITSMRVTVQAPHRHRHRGNLFRVHLDVRLPDREIAVGREHRYDHAHEDVYVAIRDSFDAATRQVENYVRIRRGDVKRHDVPGHGKVVRILWDRDAGFVALADGTQVYFHAHSVPGGVYSKLKVGDEVRIVVAEGDGEAGPQASTVIPVGKHHLIDRPGR